MDHHPTKTTFRTTRTVAAFFLYFLFLCSTASTTSASTWEEVSSRYVVVVLGSSSRYYMMCGSLDILTHAVNSGSLALLFAHQGDLHVLFSCGVQPPPPWLITLLLLLGGHCSTPPPRRDNNREKMGVRRKIHVRSREALVGWTRMVLVIATPDRRNMHHQQ